jgi:cytoskeletal protein RodZ
MRAAHNTDIGTVASTLRIRQVYLQAIEDGRFDDLPGPTYAAGFVRAYAEYLGLDISETMQRYRDVTGNASAQAPLVAPSPVVEGRMPTGFILLVAAVLAATAYGSWYYLSLNGRDAGDIVAQLPQQIADMVGLSSDEELKTTLSPATPGSAEQEPAASASAGTDPAEMRAATEKSDAVEVETPIEPAKPPAVVETAPVAPVPVRNETPVVTVATETSTEAASRPREIVEPEPSSDVAPTSDSAAAGPDAVAGGPGRSSQAEVVVTPIAVASPIAVTPAAVPADAADAGTNLVTAADTPTSAERADTAGVAPLATQQAALPEAPATAAPPEAGRVVLRATAISWVELRDGAGKRVFSRLLKKGETYNVPAQPGITLATGNAGALDILVDGQTIAPIGPPGAVRRDVLLEPGALLERSPAGR